MGDPEIHNDEKVLVRTPGVYVKSIPFEGILTSKRIVLVDRAKNLLPPKEIPLATVKSVESGENAIRDQILSLSVLAKTGETRQMILTFSRQEGGNRKKERDEWLRHIQANIGTSFDTVIRKVIPASETPPRKAEPPVQSRISIISSPVKPAIQPPVESPPPRQSESAHPITRIIEASKAQAAAPKPVTPVPEHVVFCSRCGNKVPADSAFCNRCGSPIVPPAATPQYTPPAPVTQPVAPAAPAAAPPAPPVAPVRPIDRDIGSIEPLIERSAEKAPADPLRKPVPDVPVRESISWEEEEEEDVMPVAFPVITPASSQPSPQAAPTAPREKKGFLPKIFSSKAGKAASPAPSAPPAVPPIPPSPRRGGGFAPSRNLLLGIGAVVVILVILAAGVFVVLPMLGSGGISLPSGSGDDTPSTTSGSSTTINPSGTIVIKETPAVTIPVTGVYVHVKYLGGFKGSYGMPDEITVVPGNSGDRVWEVENASGTVIAQFEKLDGSAHELLVEIYKDSVPLTSGSTTIGHGSVELSVDTTTGIALDPVTSG